MRAVRNTEAGLAVVDVEEPAGDGVVLDVVAASFCGTDFGLVAMGSTGYTLGHEFAGTVDGVPYAVEPSIWCGKCDQCLAGFTQRCVGERGCGGRRCVRPRRPEHDGGGYGAGCERQLCSAPRLNCAATSATRLPL